MPISAQLAPDEAEKAASIEPCSSLLIERAALRIQNTIEVRMMAATTPTIASKSSWAFCGNSALTSCSPAPTKSDMATARKMPTQITGIHADRPVWRR